MQSLGRKSEADGILFLRSQGRLLLFESDLIQVESSPINSMLYAPWCSIMSLPHPKVRASDSENSGIFRPLLHVMVSLAFRTKRGLSHSFQLTRAKAKQRRGCRAEKLGLLLLPFHALPSHFHYMAHNWRSSRSMSTSHCILNPTLCSRGPDCTLDSTAL